MKNIVKMVRNKFRYIAQVIEDWKYRRDLKKQSRRVATVYLAQLQNMDSPNNPDNWAKVSAGLQLTSDPNQYAFSFNSYNYPELIKRLILTSTTIDVVVKELYKRGATIEQIKTLLQSPITSKTAIPEEYKQLMVGAFRVIESQYKNNTDKMSSEFGMPTSIEQVDAELGTHRE